MSNAYEARILRVLDHIHDHTVCCLVQRDWAVAHTGPYTEIGRKFEHVATVFNSRTLWPHARGMAGLYYDDPSAVPAAELRSQTRWP